MARAPGHSSAAPVGQATMLNTIQCPECGVVLNVPDSAAGRRLRCPHCAAKFAAPDFKPASSGLAGGGPASSPFSSRGVGSSGSVEFPSSRSSGDFDLPTSPGPLRDTFDLPLLADDPPARPGAASRPASADPAAADAAALFRDEPKSARRPKGAEARSQARRCPSCSGVVPIGMSLCTHCGLDLDTGRRVAPLDIIEDEMPEATRPASPPMGLIFVGAVAGMGFLIL